MSSDLIKVKIRTWESMEKEFGLSDEGFIKCKNSFIKEMEEQMPEDRIISVYRKDDENYIWNIGCWTITDEMIKL